MIDEKWAADIFEQTVKKVLVQCERLDGAIPYIPVDGYFPDYGVIRPAQWTNGFWGGMLWQVYHATGNEACRTAAERLEERLDATFHHFVDLHHDVGFMWMHTAVANYRLTGNEQSLRRGLHAAGILAGRYNPSGRFINAWNDERTGWMIIDCMMNLPLLYWAAAQAKLPHYGFIAENHAYTTLNVLTREDGSVHHIGVMDVKNTGQPLEFPHGQGYASGSSWSRGHGWAIYGFALSHKYTEIPAFLDKAKSIAHYFIANIARSGFIPVIDFRAPAEPHMTDTTAGLIAACGMLEIAEHVGKHEQDLYNDMAKKIIHATVSKYADFDTARDGIVGGGSVAYHDREKHVPIIYGDYFLVEAVLRILGKHVFLW